MKRLLRHPSVQKLLAHLLGLYLAFALRTTRWRLEGVEHVVPHAAGAPVVVAFWHERLPMMPMLWLLARRLPEGRASRARAHVLVSQHRDGQFIGAVVSRFRLDVVLGSSSRGGTASVRNLLALLAAGDHVAITPDGPRGPCYVVQEGVISTSLQRCRVRRCCPAQRAPRGAACCRPGTAWSCRCRSAAAWWCAAPLLPCRGVVGRRSCRVSPMR